MPLRHLSTLLALLWMMVIFYLSSQSIPALNLGFPNQDKVLHLGAYGLLSMFILGGMQQSASGYRTHQMVAAALLTILYGCSDEWHQSFVPGRMFDGLDVLADTLGAVLGTLALQIFIRKRNPALRR